MEKESQINKANLKKLAEYLIELPEGYQNFEMSGFLYYDVPEQDEYNGYGGSIFPDEIKTVVENNNYVCGTVGCAIGHGPLAGILVSKTDDNDWLEYSNRVFMSGPEYDDVWQWCFGGAWCDIDNSPQGAGKRILYYLEHGLPNDWEDQIEGIIPVCYQTK